MSKIQIYSFTKFLFNFNSECLNECTNLFEKFLDEKMSIFENILNEKTAHLSKEEKVKYLHFTDTDSDLSTQIFKVTEFYQIFRSALFIKLYSTFENALEMICNESYVAHCPKLKLKDISGKGIFRSKTYLEKVCGFNFKTNDNIWENIVKYNRLRNCFVHSVGIIKDDKEATEIQKLCKDISGVQFEIDVRQIILLDSFINMVMNDFNKLIEHLESQYEISK